MRQFALPASATVVAAAALALLIPAGPASAHAGVDAVASLAHGLAHPLTGLDHLLAMVAVGLLAARLGGRALWALPTLFLAGMALGGGLGMAGLVLPAVETGIVGSVILLGLLLCLAPGLSARAGGARDGVTALAVVLAAMSGLFHGAAHGAEMPAHGDVMLYGLGFLLATAALHGGGILAVLGLKRSMRVALAGYAVRACGLLIGVAGTALAVAA